MSSPRTKAFEKLAPLDWRPTRNELVYLRHNKGWAGFRYMTGWVRTCVVPKLKPEEVGTFEVRRRFWYVIEVRRSDGSLKTTHAQLDDLRPVPPEPLAEPLKPVETPKPKKGKKRASTSHKPRSRKAANKRATKRKAPRTDTKRGHRGRGDRRPAKGNGKRKARRSAVVKRGRGKSGRRNATDGR